MTCPRKSGFISDKGLVSCQTSSFKNIPVVSAQRKVGHCVASFAKATERKPHSAVVAGRKTSFIAIFSTLRGPRRRARDNPPYQLNLEGTCLTGL